MFDSFKRVYAILTPKERKRGLILLSLMVVLAFVEVAGVTSIAPFLYVLGNPDVVSSNVILSRTYKFLNPESVQSFLFSLGIFSFIVLLLAAFYRSLVYYMMTRFANMQRHSISSRLLGQYLRQPYDFFLKSNSSEMSKKILSEADHVVIQAVIPMLNIMTSSLLLVTIVGMLIFLNPILALVVSSLFISFYVILYLCIRRYTYYIGKDLKEANSQRFKIASETLRGVKELKVLGRESVYLRAFMGPSKRYSIRQATQSTLLRIPEFFVEVLAFGTILLMALYKLNTDANNFGKMLPLLGLYGFSAVKLKPSMQLLFGSISQMKFVDSILDVITKDLEKTSETKECDSTDRLRVREGILLQEVTFTYPNQKKPVLKNISLNIPTHTKLGIVGSTGSGKSTLIDIILGLIQPDSGKVLIDETLVDEKNARTWQNAIGYVPQHIFLADESIAQNIAFGVEEESINFEALKKAASVAQILDFITELPDGYDTVIGELGVRLSGGERQRIGIARALYHDPDVLILDEATSALDNATEAKLMSAINEACKFKTVIMIAHRLSSIEYCDQMVEVEAGSIKKIS